MILDLNLDFKKEDKAVNKLTDFVISKYLEGEYKEIHLIYTFYRNSMIFIPKDYMILPFGRNVTKAEDWELRPIIEPSEEILLDALMPLYLRTQMNAKILESNVCEQAARCNAMESATDNANELLDALNIEFNKARQASITQEITEIVGAAEAI